MNTTYQLTDRVADELIEAGLTRRWRLGHTIRDLDDIIADDEHIEAVAGGYYQRALTIMAVTNHRILLASHRPLFGICDEFSFDMITGVKHIGYGLYSSVVLHTRIGDYRIDKVTNYCARTLTAAIERKLYSQPHQDWPDPIWTA